ncbi:MAG TPA: hypothetical protein VGI57_11325 [Usitatibacter sp.]|jgi:hypothetical protein
MKTTISTALLAASVAAALGGCASGGSMYSQPYAQFVPERRSATDDTRPAMVMRIDDRMADPTRDDPVPPGVHKVEVSVPGPPGMSDPKRVEITVDAKPCTRYYFSAKRATRTDTDWQGFVSASEPIGECQKKFPDAKY